ncbi:MAG: hypothetical protein JWN34_4853 [Bryobacterales bacterium]|nr:hypothetical protein [Bryobacterales bacterium]
MKRRGFGSERGQALVMVSLAIMMIFGLLGLTVDVGWMHFRQEAAQTAADAAAAAAAQAAVAWSGGSITCGSSHISCQTTTVCPASLPATLTTTAEVACAYARDNGFPVTARQTVSVTAGAGSAPPSAPGVTVGYWITVRVAETIPQLFSAIFGNRMGTASARATAAASGAVANSCLYALDPSMKSAFSVSGGSVVNASCGVFVNSSNSQALTVTGGARVNTSVAKVVGGYNISGGGVVSPSPVTGAAAIADPFAALPAPSFSGCDHTSLSVGNGATVVLSPGVYCNGITLIGGSRVTFQPGVYIIDGGGVTMGGGTTVTGSGVTIFNTNRTYAYKPFNIAGGAGVTLAAPVSGTWGGILFYNDRTITSSTTNSFSGGTLLQLTGSLYFPSTPVTYSGGSATTVTAIIAQSVIFTGGSYLAYDMTGTKTGLGKINTNLIE